MADFQLHRIPDLGGYSKNIGSCRLREEVNLGLLSLAYAETDRQEIAVQVQKTFGCDMPSPKQSILSKDENIRLIWMQPDQIFLISEHERNTEIPQPHSLMNGKGYFTDQTDGWTGLSIIGSGARSALERVCPIDLSSENFPLGASARTQMEHLHVLIVRTGADTFLLCSASSSAKSFLHMLETSAQNVA